MTSTHSPSTGSSQAPRLRRTRPQEYDPASAGEIDAETREIAQEILDDVRRRAGDAVLEHARRLGDIGESDRATYSRDECDAARNSLPGETRELLERTAERIRTFATAQLASLREVVVPVVGGQAGQSVEPLRSAGCYAPAGRFPLCSSVLMTAITARTAGVSRVQVATPKPTAVMLACAAIAEADCVLAVGGAQAVGALVYGWEPIHPVDVLVGPGNRFVTAAKEIVSGRVKIDMPAGPTELVVLADADASPATVAADLLAQAEHDDDARPILVTPSVELVEAVDLEIERQLADLPTRATAATAIERNGAAVLTADLDEAVAACNEICPEHLQVSTSNAREIAPRLERYGAIFIGETSAEVFGDYGIGPNHVLPTAMAARYRGGLSVLDFVRVATWMTLDDGPDIDTVANDAAALARLEGLEGHARAAEMRRR